MAISSGGISTDAPIPDELVAIYQGGAYFLERMRAFEDAKNSAMAALAQLKLGNEILGAQAEAQAKSDAAAKLYAEAQTHLDNSKAQAASTIDEANKKAQAIIESANAQAANLVNNAASTKVDADAYAAKVKSDIDRMHLELTDRVNEATATTADLKGKVAAAEIAKSAAEQAKASHDDAKSTYEQKIAQIKAVMS